MDTFRQKTSLVIDTETAFAMFARIAGGEKFPNASAAYQLCNDVHISDLIEHAY
jgi:hypothetical protein